MIWVLIRLRNVNIVGWYISYIYIATCFGRTTIIRLKNIFATLGLLNWQRMRCFIRSHIIVFYLFIIPWDNESEMSAISIARKLPVGLQFTRDTRILLRSDVLCAKPSHPVTHVFLALQFNNLGRSWWECLCMLLASLAFIILILVRATFDVHERQRDLRLGKLVVTFNHAYPK
jgi:hypothetical protein